MRHLLKGWKYACVTVAWCVWLAFILHIFYRKVCWKGLSGAFCPSISVSGEHPTLPVILCNFVKLWCTVMYSTVCWKTNTKLLSRILIGQEISEVTHCLCPFLNVMLTQLLRPCMCSFKPRSTQYKNHRNWGCLCLFVLPLEYHLFCILSLESYAVWMRSHCTAPEHSDFSNLIHF